MVDVYDRDFGGQGTSYFSAREKQLGRSESTVEPPGIPFIKEIIQNADDRKAKQIFLVFTDKSLWITNDGQTFNYNEKLDKANKRVAGDLSNLLQVEGGEAESEQGRVGRHGTGFELVYTISNTFEIHWWDKNSALETEGFGRISLRSNPELLESGAANTWDNPRDSDDFDDLACPFDFEDRPEDLRGVMFKADWRTESDSKKLYGDKKDIFNRAAFPVWTIDERRSFFESVTNYMPFMIQFGRSIESMSAIWIEKGGKTEFSSSRRSKCYSNDEYTGVRPNLFHNEEVRIDRFHGSLSLPNDSPESVSKVIIDIWNRDLSSTEDGISHEEIRFLHAWSSVHAAVGNSEDKERDMVMDKQITLSSHKLPAIKKFHTHQDGGYCNAHSCPLNVPGMRDQWVPDRKSVVHIHAPLDSIEDDLGKLLEPGKTLLHSILPLGAVSQNQFIVSADLYVNEGRSQLEVSEDKGVWNSSSALTLFWLHSNLFEEMVVPSSLEAAGISEEAVLQMLPTNPDDWFGGLGLNRKWFPTGEELLGKGERGKLYFDYSEKRWIPDTNGKLCKPKEIFIPTNSKGTYDEDIRNALEGLGLSVMSSKFHAHVLSAESYILEQLKRLLRGREAYSAELDISPIIESISKVELNDFNTESKVALARLVLSKDASFNGPVFPDSNGKIRTRSELKMVPDSLDCFVELIGGEIPEIHPAINDIVEPEEMAVGDVLSFIRLEHERGRFENFGDDKNDVDIMTRLADQILSNKGITEEQKISFDFIPCTFGNKTFLRGHQHFVRCPYCNDKNPPILYNLAECNNDDCGKSLYKSEFENRIPLPQGHRPEYWSRMHIMSPEDVDIPYVSERVVKACSGEHFTSKLASSSEKNLQLIRYMGAMNHGQNTARQDSLFDESSLYAWLELHDGDYDSDDIEMCRQTLLHEVRKYAKGGTQATLSSTAFSNSPVFYDKDCNWAPASEFILYADESTLEMIHSGEDSMRAIHPDLREPNREDNEWMCAGWLGGAKMDLDFSHILGAIGKSLGESIDSWSRGDKSNSAKLAKLAMHLIKNPELMPDDQSEEHEKFHTLSWIPIGNQKAFEGREDFFCKWSEFPMPGPAYDSVWGEEKENPHITLNGDPVSPLDYFDDEDIQWMHQKSSENADYAKRIGVSDKPSRERMFVTHVSHEHGTNDPVTPGLISHLSELDEIPENYSGNDLCFYHSRRGEWFHLETEGDDGNGLAIIVNSDDEAIRIPGSIPISGLGDEDEALLTLLGGKSAFGPASPYALGGLLSDFEASRESISLLEKLWYHYHRTFSEAEKLENQPVKINADKILFPYRDRLLKVEDLLLVSSGQTNMMGLTNKGSLHSIEEIKQGDEFIFRGSSLNSALVLNGATSWDKLTEITAEMFQVGRNAGNEMMATISSICTEIFPEGEEVDETDAICWMKSMLELKWAYSSAIVRVPMPHWIDGELVVEEITDPDSVFLASPDSEHLAKLFKFKIYGLGVLLSNESIFVQIHDTVHPFPDFDSGVQRRSVELDESSRDTFSDLEYYLSDVAQALEFRFGISDNENPLSTLSSEVRAFRTADELNDRWECGGVEVDYGLTNWSIVFEGDTSCEVTFRTSISGTKPLLREITKKVLSYNIRNENYQELRDNLEQDFGLEEGDYDIVSELMILLDPLLDRPNPATWYEVEGFGDVWESGSGRAANLRSELILNPDVQDANDTIGNWYSSDGCQICGQLTPSAPDGDSFQEKNVQVFKKMGTSYIWRTETLMEGVIGNLLYLCPNHHQIHQKHCLKIMLRVEGDGEPVELSELVERIKRGESNIESISRDGGLRYKTYEKRASASESYFDDEEVAELGASWTDPTKIRFERSGQHETQVMEQVIKYIKFKTE